MVCDSQRAYRIKDMSRPTQSQRGLYVFSFDNITIAPDEPPGPSTRSPRRSTSRREPSMPRTPANAPSNSPGPTEQRPRSASPRNQPAAIIASRGASQERPRATGVDAAILAAAMSAVDVWVTQSRNLGKTHIAFNFAKESHTSGEKSI